MDPYVRTYTKTKLILRADMYVDYDLAHLLLQVFLPSQVSATSVYVHE